MMLKIVALREDLFGEYLDLAKTMQEECEPDIPFDDIELLTNMFRCVNDEDRRYLQSWLCYRNKKLIGMAVAASTPFYFSGVSTAILHYWYVLPKYRGTRAAAELLREFERWAREIGAVRAYVGAERINDLEFADRVNTTIERLGYSRFGHQFYKVLNNGSILSSPTT